MNFDIIIIFFQENILTIIFGLIGLIGFILAIYFRMNPIKPKPVYQYYSSTLITKDRRILPESIDILFSGRSIPRLTKFIFIFWNQGDTLKGGNIDETQLLKLIFQQNTEILQARIINKYPNHLQFLFSFDTTQKNILNFSFDYLEKNHAVALEILHTGSNHLPDLSGVIIGIPEGIKNLGKFSLEKNPYSKMTIVTGILAIALIVIIVISQNIVNLFVFAIYLGLFAYLLYSTYRYRRKIPKQLKFD